MTKRVTVPMKRSKTTVVKRIRRASLMIGTMTPTTRRKKQQRKIQWALKALMRRIALSSSKKTRR